MSTRSSRRFLAPLAAASAAAALVVAQCSSPFEGLGEEVAKEVAPLVYWESVYDVLQHPRCLNCHPAGDVPLQGDASLPHAQNVQRGSDGNGLYGMRCATCHQTRNLDGPHLPPGAPNWHLPYPSMPLVFEGLSSGELCRQLKDPARNGGKTPERLLEHVAHDPLVLWGWSPGEDRAPVAMPHDMFVRVFSGWIDGGCPCPD